MSKHLAGHLTRERDVNALDGESRLGETGEGEKKKRSI